MRFDSLVEDSNLALGEDYSKMSPSHPVTFGTEIQRLPTGFVAAQLPCGSTEPLNWNISVRENTLYGIPHVLGRQPSFLSGDLIEAMHYTLLTPPCEHQSHTPAGDVAQLFKLVQYSFSRPFFGKYGMPNRRILVSVGRDYRRQIAVLLWTLCYQEHFKIQYVVVHLEGCIRCALQLCLDCNASVVIS